MVVFHIPTNKNQVVVWNQLRKIEKAGRDTDTVILGDSSAGFAIDIGLFNELTGRKAINLALTASFGIHNNLLMLQQARLKLPNLKYVLFIYSAPAWMEPFNDEAYYLLSHGLSPDKNPLYGFPDAREARRNYLNWLFTPERFLWAVNNLRQPDYERGIWDNGTAYIIQGPIEPKESADKKWPLRMPLIEEEEIIPYLEAWAELCGELRCVYAHGPQYSEFIDVSRRSIDKIDGLIMSHLSKTLDYKRDLYQVGYDMLGDSRSHIRTERIEESTRHYAAFLR